MRAIVADDRIRARKYVFDSENKSVEYVNGTTNRINLANNPRFTNTSGTVEVRRNYFANPRGENSTAWATFAGVSGVTTHTGITGITDHPVGISTARRVTWTTGTTSASGGVFCGNNVASPVTAGLTYTASIWVRPSITQNILPGIDWKRADYTTSSLTYGAFTNVPAGKWTRLSVTGVAPADATYMYITAYVGGAGAPWPTGATLDVTGALLDKTPTVLDYFDGSYSPDPDLSPVWVGTANASQSYLRGFVPKNISAYSSFAVASSYGMRMIPNKSADNNSRTRVGGLSSGLSGNGVTFTPGKWYGFQAVCTLLAPQTGSINSSARTMQLASNKINGWTDSRNVSSSQPPNEAGSYHEELVAQLPTDSVWASLYLCNGASFGGGDVYWDKLLIVEGDTEEEVRRKLAQGYFDGDTQVNAETINNL